MEQNTDLQDGEEQDVEVQEQATTASGFMRFLPILISWAVFFIGVTVLFDLVRVGTYGSDPFLQFRLPQKENEAIREGVALWSQDRREVLLIGGVYSTGSEGHGWGYSRYASNYYAVNIETGAIRHIPDQDYSRNEWTFDRSRRVTIPPSDLSPLAITVTDQNGQQIAQLEIEHNQVARATYTTPLVADWVTDLEIQMKWLEPIGSSFLLVGVVVPIVAAWKRQMSCFAKVVTILLYLVLLGGMVVVGTIVYAGGWYCWC